MEKTKILVQNQNSVIYTVVNMLKQDKAMIPHIIEQHAEEAAFLWLLRSNAVDAPHYDLNALAKLDDRIDAHLDGLRVSGDYGWAICRDNLQIKESGEVFAAAILALEGHSMERINLVYNVIEQTPGTINGLVSAFGWVEPHNLQGKVNRLLLSENPLWRQIGVAVCSIHRIDPGRFLEQAIIDDNIHLRVRALKAVGELGRVDLKDSLLALLNHDNEKVKFWAAWSAVLIGDRGLALCLLRQEIESNSIFCNQAMQVAFPVLDTHSIKKTLRILAVNKDVLRLAIIGAGISGDSCYIPWLIEQMENSNFARVAGEAFSYLCGVDLVYQDLESELQDDGLSGPNEDPKDENVAMDLDEDLPNPDPMLVQQWWQNNKKNFKSDVRYFYGKPLNQTRCEWLLRNGTQRLRYSAALILAIMQPDQAIYEVRANGKRQQKALNKTTSV